jgi:phage-related protein
MARIIGEAGVRLVMEGRGLDQQIKRVLVSALRDASGAIDTDATKPLRDDVDRTGTHIRKVLGTVSGVVGSVASGFVSALTSGLKLALIGAAAGTALAGVSSLFTGVVGLVGVLGQVAGLAGLLPAAFLGIKAATATVKLGMTGIADSFKALNKDAAAFEESLKELAPQAQVFMRAIRDQKGAFDQLQLNVQNQLFAGLGAQVGKLAGTYLPIANRLFVGMAGSINQAAREATSFVLQGQNVGQVRALVDNLRAAFSNVTPAITPLLSAFLDISEVGSRFLPQLTSGLTSAAQRFSEFIGASAASGDLEAFFQNAIDKAKQLGSALADFGAGFANVFAIADQAGGGFLNSLSRIGAEFRAFTESAQGSQALLSFFTAMRQVIAAVLPVFTQIAVVIGRDLAPILANLAATIGPALVPVVQGFGAAFRAAAPGIAALAEGIAAFLQGAAPLLPVLGQLAGIVGGALGAVFEALAPVLREVASVLSDSLAAVLPQLQPVFSQIAQAVAQLVRAAVPLIPLFLQLVAALLPIIPPLIQMAAALLPPIIDLIMALMPLIQGFAQVLVALIPPLTEIAVAILGVLIPPLKLIIAIVSQVVQFVGAAFRALSGVVTAIFSAIRNVIVGAWQAIFNIVTGIVNGIGNGIRNGFNAVFRFFGNIMSSIGNAVRNGINAVGNFFRDLPGKVLGFLASLPGKLFQMGVDVVKGLIDGIKSWVQNAINAVIDFGKDIINGITGALGIGSPSKEFRKVGVFAGQGLILGIRDMTDPAARAAADMATAVLDAAGGLDLTPRSGGLTSPTGDVNRAANAAAGVAASVVLRQTNIMQPGADVSQFATEVYRQGAQQLAAAGSAISVANQGVQRGLPADGYVTGVSL